MSSSSRNSVALRFAVACGLAAGALCAPAAWSAQYHVQPQFDLRVENNDNFGLVPGGSPDSDVYGVIANAQALFGIYTPRSETSLRPRLKLQEYPDREDLQQWEGYLDLRSRYEWQRGEFLVNGRYSHEDSYTSETPSGVYDPLDPLYGSDPDSVQILVGETRKRFDLRPSFRYDATERLNFGAEAQYVTVNFDSDGAETNTDYDYTLLKGSVGWVLTPVSDFRVGAYASKYEAKDDSTDTDGYGGEVGYRYRWSEVTGVEATVNYEQNDITDYVPVRSEESTSGWGGNLTAYRELEVSEWRLSIGRRFIPTGDGGKSVSDSIRMEYDRDLSERLAFEGAARFETRNTLREEGSADDDRKYARVDLALEWFMTPTWYVKGGYSYIWNETESATGSAENNKVFVSFGYRGLRRERR